MKTVLFVAYGSGHIKMVVPVAQALAASGRARPVVLALTTAAPVALAAGLDVVQFKDFVEPGDEAALAYGRRLMASLGAPVADVDETVAYLGLSFFDLVQGMGSDHAEADYRLRGRQAFLPVPTLRRILQSVKPDLVVATNAPRAERAAIVAARQLGVPSVCMVDLFAIDEVQWIGAPDYADRVCVLNESVRQFLIQAGRQPDKVVVTGNPGFDALQRPSTRERGSELRRARGWDDKRVILWPNQVEPSVHPFEGRPGSPDLPARVLVELLGWVQSRADGVLCVRARAGESLPGVPVDPRVVLTGQDWPLGPLLYAVDMVVTLSSTVGLEGRLAGCRLIQVLGSVFDDAMPLARFGLADEAVPLDGVARALDRWRCAPRHAFTAGPSATPAVLEVISEFL
ncbi:MAG: UDP-glycosyltransferase [Burkholderiaceae bacterium]|uniref:UDP-glycosyltransferase n=1 Tax=Hydrogenophaga sp. TaxID=1904254 RepID=UPI0027747C4D|nr:UDP-glycosyltransferase [Hydrogenophaga sp.]MDP2066117.1 UDP-glycosyltransferase [Burkholderiaceae bacterium]MDZ4143310.1 UDP-glycosyltransferase [Burkholderiales bacterium]MDZ4398694.1 UDP-glycosyltransferase [Hydrogenophaga sp.]